MTELTAISGSRKTEAELTDEYRKELQPRLEEIAKLMNRIKTESGFLIEFNLGLDQFGMYRASPVYFVRRF